MILLISILIIAWIIGAIMKEDLRIGFHLVQFMQDFLSFNGMIFIPVAIFILSAFIAFSTGTSWGTIAIVTPFCIDIALHIGLENINISIALAVVLSGSLFGDLHHLYLIPQ